MNFESLKDSLRLGILIPEQLLELVEAVEKLVAGPPASTTSQINMAILKRMRIKILAKLEKDGFKNPRVFGSVLRGDAREDSDVDLLVKAPANVDIFKMGTMLDSLEEITGLPIDLHSKEFLGEDVYLRAKKVAVAL